MHKKPIKHFRQVNTCVKTDDLKQLLSDLTGMAKAPKKDWNHCEAYTQGYDGDIMVEIGS